MEVFHTEKYLKSGGDYPLRPNNKKSGKFLENFTSFWECLVHNCRAKIIYDSYLMPSLNAWLVTFSRFAFLSFFLSLSLKFRVQISAETVPTRRHHCQLAIGFVFVKNF